MEIKLSKSATLCSSGNLLDFTFNEYIIDLHNCFEIVTHEIIENSWIITLVSNGFFDQINSTLKAIKIYIEFKDFKFDTEINFNLCYFTYFAISKENSKFKDENHMDFAIDIIFNENNPVLIFCNDTIFTTLVD